MTRKDYAAIAGALASARPHVGAYHGVVDLVAANIADVLAADNPRFDRERFLSAARGEG